MIAFPRSKLRKPESRYLRLGHPLAVGLVAYWFLDGGPLPWLRNAEVSVPTFGNGARWGPGSDGLALFFPNSSSTDGLRYSGTGITFNVPNVTGTLVGQGRASFSPTDNLEHNMISIWAAANAAFPNENGLTIIKWTDNVLYLGWGWGADQRVSFAAAGLWGAGSRVQIGVTWDAGPPITRAYVNGIARATGTASLSGLGNTGGTANSIIYLGNDRASGIDQSYGWNESLDWVAVWDRVLTPAEITRLYVDPYAFRVPVRTLTLDRSTATVQPSLAVHGRRSPLPPHGYRRGRGVFRRV